MAQTLLSHPIDHQALYVIVHFREHGNYLLKPLDFLAVKNQSL